jgi:DNA invertase Pin-like site-specific DNA recombinase
MQIGYARTSTVDQTAGFEAQLAELAQAGCEKVFREQVSSVGPRAQLEAALDCIREGDALVVSKLDRLARSTQHLLGDRGQGEPQGGTP